MTFFRKKEPIVGEWHVVREGSHVAVGIYRPLKADFRPAGGHRTKDQPATSGTGTLSTVTLPIPAK